MENRLVEIVLSKSSDMPRVSGLNDDRSGYDDFFEKKSIDVGSPLIVWDPALRILRAYTDERYIPGVDTRITDFETMVRDYFRNGHTHPTILTIPERKTHAVKVSRALGYGVKIIELH